MSRAKGLLKRFMHELTKEELCSVPDELQAEIEELLAQSEQEHVGIVRIIGGYPDDSEHVVDWLCKYKDLKEGDRLYLAPSKREPLSEDTMLRLISEHRYFPPNLVRAIEKAHGIGVDDEN